MGKVEEMKHRNVVVLLHHPVTNRKGELIATISSSGLFFQRSWNRAL